MPASADKNKGLQLVPETILKKRHDLDHLVRVRAASVQQQQQRKQRLYGYNKKKAIYVKKPETILARAKAKRHNDIRYKRVLKKGMQKRASNRKETATKEIVDETADETVTTTTTYQSNSVGADMVFCVRVRDHVGAPRSVRRALSRLRLRNVHEGVFCRYDASHRKLLHLVEPWVVYGPPSAQVVKDLVERRGFCKDAEGKRIPLSDNTVIEEALGEDCNIICVEDLVHELVTVGDNFSKASKFLWPFRLADSKTEFERRTLKKKDGKDYGDKGAAVNDYIQQVL